MGSDLNITEEQIKTLGFEFVKTYNHDQFITNRYKRGLMEVEFTYEDSRLQTCDLTISELNCMPVDFEDIKKISEVIGDFKF